MNANNREDSLTLEILETIEKHDNLTQRHLADSLGVALGLTNSYLKRCVRKGLIKVQQAPANRLLYYLTPKGFAEKSRLTASYLSYSFDFYRRAGDSLSKAFSSCEKNHLNSVILCGVSELAEIASLRSYEYKIDIVGVFDPNSKKEDFLHLPVWKNLNDVEAYDAYVVTSLDDAVTFIDLLRQKITEDKILIPSILGISSTKN
jgi:DNA-binding MarR family transcriptional regulator